MGNSLREKTWVIIVIAVIIIAAILIYAFYFQSSSQKSGLGNVSYAPAGQLVTGFPANLILTNGSSTAPQESYSIAYPSSTQQLTATFVDSGSVKDSMVSLFDAYQLYFYNNGWQVTSVSLGVPTMRSMSATKGSENANVTIASQSATSSQITVSYVATP